MEHLILSAHGRVNGACRLTNGRALQARLTKMALTIQADGMTETGITVNAYVVALRSASTMKMARGARYTSIEQPWSSQW